MITLGQWIHEEFLDRIRVHQPDIAAVSETWFSINKPAREYPVPGYILIHKDREDRRAGGVALYLRSNMPIRNANISVPTDLECVWVLVRGNFGYNIKIIAVCSVYYPPYAPHHDELMEHLISSVDTLRTNFYTNISKERKILFKN